MKEKHNPTGLGFSCPRHCERREAGQKQDKRGRFICPGGKTIPVIASEAKQSSPIPRVTTYRTKGDGSFVPAIQDKRGRFICPGHMDCFVAALLATTEDPAPPTRNDILRTRQSTPAIWITSSLRSSQRRKIQAYRTKGDGSFVPAIWIASSLRSSQRR
jgi:hypothetical protein